MEARVAIFSLLVSLMLFGLIFELVRRRRLKERYSLMWLLTALTLMTLAVSKGLMDRLSVLVGIYYSPSMFFLLAFIFLMLITLQFSVVISRLSERNKVLSQEMALLKLRVEQMEKREGTGGE